MINKKYLINYRLQLSSFFFISVKILARRVDIPEFSFYIQTCSLALILHQLYEVSVMDRNAFQRLVRYAGAGPLRSLKVKDFIVNMKRNRKPI